MNDAQSYRLAIFYGVGETREEAVARCRERAPTLSFRLAPAACSLTSGSPSPRASRFEIPTAPDRGAGEGERGREDHACPEPVDRGVAELGRGLVLARAARRRRRPCAPRRRAR